MNTPDSDKQEFQFEVISKMLHWFLCRTNGPRSLIDNLSQKEQDYVESVLPSCLKEPADAEWCEEYYIKMCGELSDPVRKPTSLRTNIRYPATRYEFVEIIDYLWDNRDSIMAQEETDTDAIAKAAIRFIHDVYIQNYTPCSRASIDEAGPWSCTYITRGKFIGIGDFEEAWKHAIVRFYQTATTRHYLKWMEHYIRIFAETMYDPEEEHAIPESTSPFEKGLINVLVNNRDIIGEADVNLGAELYILLIEKINDLFSQHFSKGEIDKIQYLMAADAIFRHLDTQKA